MRNDENLRKKYSGWYGTYRGKFLLLKNKVLTKEEFILYEASIAFADWDKNHFNKYGTLDLKQHDIEYLIGVSDGFVSRYGKNLIKKKFWNKRDDGLIQVVGFELIEISLLTEMTKKNLIIDLQKYFADQQIGVENSQQKFANLQKSLSKEKGINQPQKFANLQRIVSKSDLVSYKDKVIILRNDEEYKKIKEEISFRELSIDDMKWIDLNVYEDPNVSS